MKNLIILSLIFLCGCGLADLRGQKEGFSAEAQAKGKQILNEAAQSSGVSENWSKFSEFEVTTVDHWSLSILRWLTPVQNNNQKLRFTFKFPAEESLMVFVDGKTPLDSAGIKDGKTFKIIKGRVIQKKFADVQRYLAHVRHYFLFPQIIKDYPVIAFVGEWQMEGNTYDKVYVSTTDHPTNSKEDQYLVWVNQKTKRIDYIEFTIRDILPSLKGVMVYKDYRLIDGIWLPFEITLPNGMGSKDFAHRFTVESIELKK